MSEIQEILLTLIKAVILGVIPILAGIIASFIRNKTAHITAQMKNERLRHSLNELAEAVSAAVAKTGQAYVDGIKESGMFCRDSQSKALALAKETALASLAPATQEFLTETYGSLHHLLEVKIEEKVREQKYVLE